TMRPSRNRICAENHSLRRMQFATRAVTACPVRSFQMPPARREARPGAICALGCQAPAANVQTGSSWQRCFCRTGAIFFAGAPARKKFLENRRRAAPHACVCVTNNLQTELETDL